MASRMSIMPLEQPWSNLGKLEWKHGLGGKFQTLGISNVKVSNWEKWHLQKKKKKMERNPYDWIMASREMKAWWLMEERHSGLQWETLQDQFWLETIEVLEGWWCS